MKLAPGFIKTGFTLSLLLLGAGLLVDSMSLSRTAALIPQVVISGSLVLLAAQLLLDLAAFRRESVRAGAESESPDEGQAGKAPPGSRKRFFQAVFWVLLLAVTTWGLGLVVGSAIFSLAFLRGQARESWRYSIVYSLVLATAISLIFTVVLNTSLHAGAVFEVLK